MSSLDLVKSVEDFLTATSNECYQPGCSPFIARSNLLKQLSMEKMKIHLNCDKWSDLLKYLENMLNNPPDSVQIEGKPYMNSHIMAGFQQAVKEVIFFVKGLSNV